MPISTTTTIDFGDLGRRLSSAERAVLVRHERRIMAKIRKRWRDWEYKNRPEGAPINVSLAAWKSRVESTEGGRPKLIIENHKSYVTHVHHAGVVKTEVSLIKVELDDVDVPLMRRDLSEAIAKAYEKPVGRKELGGRGGAGTARAADLVL